MTELTIIYSWLIVSLAMLLVLYDLSRVYFALMPSIITYIKTDEWRFVKDYDKLKIRKLILASVTSLILLLSLRGILPKWKGSFDADFILNASWSVALVVLICLLHKVSSKYHSTSLFAFLKYYFRRGITTDMILEKIQSEDSVTLVNVPRDLIRKELKNRNVDLQALLQKYTDLNICETSLNRLNYLINNGRLFDKKEKIVISINFIKEGQINRTQLMDFMNEFFHIEYFENLHSTKVSLKSFLDYLDENFLILDKNEKKNFFYHQSIKRWLERNSSAK